MSAHDDITGLLRRWNAGDGAARERLVPLLYDELRRLARGRLARERDDHTLGATALVHEAYLRLLASDGVAPVDQAHLLALFSRAMRHVLVDYARARSAQRRGGSWQRVMLDDDTLMAGEEVGRVIELEEALEELERTHPRPAEALSHSYFGGLTNEEIASALGISRATVERDLRFARAWLGARLEAARTTQSEGQRG